MVNPIVAKQISGCQNYVIDTKEYLFTGSITFSYLKSEFTQLHLLKFLCKYVCFPGRYRRKQKWVFFIETRCI